jgi:hypothetical protein
LFCGRILKSREGEYSASDLRILFYLSENSQKNKEYISTNLMEDWASPLITATCRQERITLSLYKTAEFIWILPEPLGEVPAAKKIGAICFLI